MRSLHDYGFRIKTFNLETEGYDKEIIKSLKPLLIAYKPNIISECNKNLTPEERSELFEILDSLNYSIKKLEGFNDESKPSSIDNPSGMMNWQHFDLVATPR